MLAMKLHKTKRPNLGKWTYWVPILKWTASERHLKNWYSTLTQPGAVKKGRNYLTLVSIPNDHPVFLKVDYSVGWGVRPRDYPFEPLCELEPDILDALKPLEDPPDEGLYHVGQGYLRFIDGSEDLSQPLTELPELILGARLPTSCVKWTKDIRLLFRGDTRTK